MKQKLLIVVAATLLFLGAGAGTAFAAQSMGHGDAADGAQPALAETGYDFTPMLITAAVLLLLSGMTVLIAKYLLGRSSHQN